MSEGWKVPLIDAKINFITFLIISELRIKFYWENIKNLVKSCKIKFLVSKLEN